MAGIAVNILIGQEKINFKRCVEELRRSIRCRYSSSSRSRLTGRGNCEGDCGEAVVVVTTDVEPWTVVEGNPAKFIKKRELKA